MVISYLDLAVLGVIMASIAFGLLFAGRPRLLALMRSPRVLAAELLALARAIKPPALPQRQPRRAGSRLRLLDPPLIVATLLMIVGAGGVASATRFTPVSATAAQPGANISVVATATAASQVGESAIAPATPAATAIPVALPSPPLAATAIPVALPSPLPATAIPVAPPTRAPDATPQIVAAEPHTPLTFNTWLRSASKGQEVALLQQRLRELGYFTYPENTGLFGTQTLEAVRQFQTDRGLPVTGLVGPLTIEELNSCAAKCAHASNPQEETR